MRHEVTEILLVECGDGELRPSFDWGWNCWIYDTQAEAEAKRAEIVKCAVKYYENIKDKKFVFDFSKCWINGKLIDLATEREACS